MNFYIIAGLAAFARLACADKTQQIQFLEVFVSDYADNKRQYVDYFMTARGVPADVTKLALRVATYKDDSYTTLVNDENINLTSLFSFATNLPWYSRIEAREAAASAGTDFVASSLSKGVGAALLAPGGAFFGAIALLLL